MDRAPSLGYALLNAAPSHRKSRADAFRNDASPWERSQDRFTRRTSQRRLYDEPTSGRVVLAPRERKPNSTSRQRCVGSVELCEEPPAGQIVTSGTRSGALPARQDFSQRASPYGLAKHLRRHEFEMRPRSTATVSDVSDVENKLTSSRCWCSAPRVSLPGARLWCAPLPPSARRSARR